MRRLSAVCVVSVAVSCWLAACDPSDPCDPGYYADHGACYRKPHASGGDDSDAGESAKSDAGGSDAPPDYSTFGQGCSDASDCGGAAPVCGAPQLPFCTQVNCMSDKTLCPADWHCLDVSAQSPDPKVTSLCVNF